MISYCGARATERGRAGRGAMRTYTDLVPTFPDQDDWPLATVLRHQAATRPDAVFLDLPEEGLTFTYAESLAQAESVADRLAEAGAQPGDRALGMGAHPSQFLRTWLGTGVGGTIEVPINTAYEGVFLEHQMATAAPRWAVVDDVHAAKFLAVASSAKVIEKFWVVDTGSRDEALAALTGAGWEAAPWEELARGARPGTTSPAPSPRDQASIFFTSGTTGPSKGVAMPHAQMYFFGQEVVCLQRVTADDVYFTCTPLFHGNAQFMAAYPALIAGARLVVRPRFSASRWVDQLRESGVTVTNLIGVMMDFIWKQPARPDDADNRLRSVFAAPTASSILEGFRGRFGVEAFVEVFGLTETSAPILAPYGEDRPAGAAGLQAADWFDVRLVDPETDREGGGRGDRRARRPPEAPVDLLDGLLRHAGEDRRGLAQPVVPHRGCAAQGRRRLVLLRRPLQGRAAPPRGEHQLLRGGIRPARPRRRRGVRGDRRGRRQRGRRGRGDGLPGHQPGGRGRRAVVVLRGPDPGVRDPAIPALRRRDAQDAVGTGAEGRAAQARDHPRHPRPAGRRARRHPLRGAPPWTTPRTRSTPRSVRPCAPCARTFPTSTGWSTTPATSSPGSSTRRCRRPAGSGSPSPRSTAAAGWA